MGGFPLLLHPELGVLVVVQPEAVLQLGVLHQVVWILLLRVVLILLLWVVLILLLVFSA